MAKMRRRIRTKRMRRCKKPYHSPVRVSKQLKDIINYVRAKYILEGKKPPSTSKITQMIAKRIDKEELLRNEFVRF